jgi:hypothetical protein
MDEVDIRRTLTWFDKTTEGLVGQEDLKGASLDDLRFIFGVAADDSIDPMMYGCYPVEERHARQLQRFVSVAIKPGEFDFFVEASRVASAG